MSKNSHFPLAKLIANTFIANNLHTSDSLCSCIRSRINLLTSFSNDYNDEEKSKVEHGMYLGDVFLHKVKEILQVFPKDNKKKRSYCHHLYFT